MELSVIVGDWIKGDERFSNPRLTQRFANREIGRFQAGLAWDGSRELEWWDFAFDQLRGNRRISRLDESPGETRHQPHKQDDRDQAQAAAHA
jgi:hypothetical protein